MIVDAGSEPQLDALVRSIAIPLVIICPDRADVSQLAAKFPAHRIIGVNELAGAEQWRPVNVSADSIAYLLFTSGSTGQPKGVMVSHANVLHYLACVTKRYGFTSNDRVSQTFDLTFDLSAHDMFAAWENGACLCCPTQKQLIKPGAFINDARFDGLVFRPVHGCVHAPIRSSQTRDVSWTAIELVLRRGFACGDRTSLGPRSAEFGD
jgi:non-ribosomal peptide synthetase component F